jgi:hypothetical protein
MVYFLPSRGRVKSLYIALVPDIIDIRGKIPTHLRIIILIILKWNGEPFIIAY